MVCDVGAEEVAVDCGASVSRSRGLSSTLLLFCEPSFACVGCCGGPAGGDGATGGFAGTSGAVEPDSSIPIGSRVFVDISKDTVGALGREALRPTSPVVG